MAPLQDLRSSDTFILIAMCIAVFTDTFIYGIIVPILPYLLIKDDIILETDIQKWTSILLAAYGAALLLGSPLIGIISDKIRSRKIPLLLGYIAIALSTLLFVFGHSSALLVVARLCQGLSGAVVGVLSFAVIADTARLEKRGEFMAYASISFTWGMITGPVLGGLLFDHFGVYGAFGLPIALLVVDVILRFLIIEKGSGNDSPSQPDEESSLLAHLQPASEPSLSLRNFFEPRFLMAIFTEVTISSILSAFEATLPLFTMQTYRWSSTNSGLVFLGISFPSLLSIPLGKYGQNWNRRRIVACELILTFFPLAALRFIQGNTVQHEIGFIALVTLVGLFVTTSQAQVMAEVSYAVREIETKHGINSKKQSGMGTGYAFCSMAIALGQFIGPIVAGCARVQAGWEGMTLVLGGISCAVGLLSLAMGF